LVYPLKIEVPSIQELIT